MQLYFIIHILSRWIIFSTILNGIPMLLILLFGLRSHEFLIIPSLVLNLDNQSCSYVVNLSIVNCDIIIDM